VQVRAIPTTERSGERGGSAGAEQRAPSAKRVVDIDNAITTDQVGSAPQSMPGTSLKLLQPLQVATHDRQHEVAKRRAFESFLRRCTVPVQQCQNALIRQVAIT